MSHNCTKAFDEDGKKDDRGMQPHILEALQNICTVATTLCASSKKLQF